MTITLDLPIAVVTRRKHGERRGCRKQRYTVTTRRIEITTDDVMAMAFRLKERELIAGVASLQPAFAAFTEQDRTP